MKKHADNILDLSDTAPVQDAHIQDAYIQDAHTVQNESFTQDDDYLDLVLEPAAPSIGEQHSQQHKLDRDWDEACRIAELLGFGSEAVQARKRSRQRPLGLVPDLRPQLSEPELKHWRATESEILEALCEGQWETLCSRLNQHLGAKHPFDAATFQQLHYLACTLAGTECAALPESYRHAEGTLVQALFDLCKLSYVALEEDLEWAFEQGLEELSPYLVGDRPGRIVLLEERDVHADDLARRVIFALGERLDLEARIGTLYRGTQLYFDLKQKPLPLVSQDDFLKLNSMAGDQSFFHSFLGRQELVHWKHNFSSIKSAFEHLWRAYLQECEYTEEPHVEFAALGDGIVNHSEQPQLEAALQEGIIFLNQTLDDSLAAARFLRHLWRKFLGRYEQVLVQIEQPDCLALLLRIKEALADEIDPGLEFLVAKLATSLKQWQHVEEGYLKGLALDPGNVEEMLALADFYKSRSRYQESRALLTKVMKLSPGDESLVRNMRAVADRLDLQHQPSPFLTDNPNTPAAPACMLEDLDAPSLLAIAAMARYLRFDDSGHLRAFGECGERIFPNSTIQTALVRELLQAGVLLVYRYSPERSYRLIGELFDFDMERVEWMLNTHSITYPDLPVDEAAIEILRDRLNQDRRQANALWLQVATHDLLEYTQRRFAEQRWNLNVTDYVYEIVASLLESLSLRRAVALIDEAIARTQQDLVEHRANIRQVAQVAVRNVHCCYERLILGSGEVDAADSLPQLESAWSRIFRSQITSLGGMYYDAAPGEVEFVRAEAF